MELTMELSSRMIQWVVDKTGKDGGRPVCVAVCDDEGFLTAFIKMDGTATRAGRLARLKAYTAAKMQTTTEQFLQRLRREQIELSYFADPRLVPMPGGAPVITREGKIIGAIGISGRTSEEDQELALFAAKLE